MEPEPEAPGASGLIMEYTLELEAESKPKSKLDLE